MRLIRTPSILFFLTLFLSSCVNNLNFDDTDLDISPIFNSPFVFFTLNQNDFFDEENNIENLNIEAILGDFDILEPSVNETLDRIVFSLEMSNLFDRDIILDIDFLDEFDEITHVVNPFRIVSGDTDATMAIGIDIASNAPFLRSTRVRIRARLSRSTTMLDPTIPREFSLKSTVTYFLNF